MASSVTPEKVKNLLSSFLAKSHKSGEDNETAHKTSNKEDGVETVLTESLNGSITTSTLRSHDKFLELTWFGKTLDLSPLICARYGWENVDADMLQCVGCKAFLGGQLPNKTDFETYETSLTKLKANLLASHDKFCILAANPCPEHFCHVPVEDTVSLMTSFTERALALNQLQGKLPSIDETDLSTVGYDIGQGGAYCERHLIPNGDIIPQAVALAFAGWTTNPANKDVLMCCMCRRQIGLWNFVHDSLLGLGQDISKESSSDEENEEEPKRKRRKILPSKKPAFNPIQEHHRWCPWIQQIPFSSLPTPPSSVSVTPSSLPDHEQEPRLAPACIIALRNIAPGLMDNNTGLASAMKMSPMIEGLRCFRRVMKTWSSPKTETATPSQPRPVSLVPPSP